MGYKNVRDYAEGKRGWIEAKLPLEGALPRVTGSAEASSGATGHPEGA